MRVYPKRLMLLLIAVPLLGCGRPAAVSASRLEEAWNADNDPAKLRDHFEVRIASLPLIGETQTKPWSDSYWPSFTGGLANRWNDPAHPSAFTYPVHTQAEVTAMTADQLKTLSPAEKYDIFLGRFDYPLTMEERTRNHADDPMWYGLCHGWAPAAFNYGEPKPVTLAGANGLQMPFGASDVKALLIYAQTNGEDTHVAGTRCNSDDPAHANDPSCKDINAGSFHIILANELGLSNTGIIADIAKGAEIWNQPVFGFKSEVTGETTQVYAGAAPGTVKIVAVKTRMRYVTEYGPRWDPMPFAAFPFLEGDRDYTYMLEVNQAGEIIGGEWAPGSDHPDFVWTQKAPILANGFFAQLQTIYDASTH